MYPEFSPFNVSLNKWQMLRQYQQGDRPITLMCRCRFDI